MAIEYNPNKKTIFNNYIDVAVSNLKKAETEASCLLNFVFPSKTIIGRRFNKKSKINTLKGNINSAYKELISIKGQVEKQILFYLTANRMAVASADKILSLYDKNLTTIYESQAKKIYKETNKNWIEISIGDKIVGYYVDDKGNIIKNATVNGVKFDENGLAKDPCQFHMMVVVTETEIPKEPYIYDGKNIEIIQNTRIIIDDDDSKIGLFRKNKKGEWVLEYYENCIGERNPAVANPNGEYLTVGHFTESEDGNAPYFELEPDEEDPRKEVGRFFYPTVKINMETGAWADMFHSDCFPLDCVNPFKWINAASEILNGTLRKTNGCTRVNLDLAKNIYEDYSEGLYIQEYDEKKFEDYNTVAKNDAIKTWTDEIEEAKSKKDTEKIEKIKSKIKENYGDEVYDLVAKEEERRNNEKIGQLASADIMNERKKSREVKSKK